MVKFNIPDFSDEFFINLLGRNKHIINQKEIAKKLGDKVVFVTGGAGSIGRKLCEKLLKYGVKQLIVYDNSEYGMYRLEDDFCNYRDCLIPIIGDVRDNRKLENTINKYAPDVVFHASAYKHVPLMEENIDEAIKTNVFGTKNVVDACQKYNVKKFVLISTDKAVNPGSVMGATKKLAEEYVFCNNNSSCVFSAVRFGNVLGTSGSVIPLFREKIQNGEDIPLTDKRMTRYFITPSEASDLLLVVGLLIGESGLYIMDMGNPYNMYELTKKLIKMCGLEPENDIRIKEVGIRAGEKTDESLTYINEELSATKFDGIRCCSGQKVNKRDTIIKITELQNGIYSLSKEELKKLLF